MMFISRENNMVRNKMNIVQLLVYQMIVLKKVLVGNILNF